MSKPRWIWQTDQVIPSRPGAGRPITHELLHQLRADRWGRRDIFCVQLALEEAICNAMTHGNRHDPDKTVRVVCRLAPKLVHIEVTDEGSGFDPDSLPDPTDDDHVDCPRGRGVMLIQSFMSRVEFSAKGSTIVMEKDRVG